MSFRERTLVDKQISLGKILLPFTLSLQVVVGDIKQGVTVWGRGTVH
jgi:hypothetical protein